VPDAVLGEGPVRAGTLGANAAAAGAALLFGASVVATRVAVQHVPPLTLAVARFGQGGLLLLAGLLVCAPRLLRVRRPDVSRLVLLGAVLFTAFPVTFNAGLRLTEASRGALMLATGPLWTAWLARRSGAERLRPAQLGGVALTVAGVGLVLGERGLGGHATAWTLAGDALLLLTALCGAIYNVLAKPMLARYSALTVTTWAMCAGPALLLPLAAAERPLGHLERLDGGTWALIVFLGALGGALGYLLWTVALTRLSPTQVMVYVNLNPMAAAVLGALWLGERLSPVFLAGFVAVLGGVVLVNRRPGR
jgi:drug/metabolite transporter (DMT)-like permease